jgi:phosphate transport system protein
MTEKIHTSIHYERELNEIQEKLLYLGALVEKAIKSATDALFERDSQRAREVIAGDDQIDRLDEAIEEKCIRLLALRQPAARDLRFIATAIKINAHLERIGDLAVNIAEKVIALNEESVLKPYIDLPRMAQMAQDMVHKSLDAFVREDMSLAHDVRRQDEDVDQLNEQIFRELLTFMLEDPRTIRRALIVMQVSKAMERICDHTERIADMVIFMITGKNVRHGKSEPHREES